jgi:hypothetical protein
MKNLLYGTLAVGLIAAPALAGSSATVTPIGGSMGSFFDNGQMSGHSYNFAPGGGAGGGPPRNLYDNIPTFLGGTADAGMFGPFGTVYGTFLFVDWTAPSAQWGGDLHNLSAGGAGPPVITSLWYGYSNGQTATNTHVIKIYDMVSPSATHGTATTTFAGFTKGALLTAVTLTGLPSGQNFVTVAIASVHAGSSVWVKLEELDNGSGAYPYTFWLTGGAPGIGYTHPGVTFTLKDYYPTYYGGTFTYNTFAAFPYFSFADGQGGYNYTHSNIAVGLNGFHIPGPAAISLLGLGGLVALRRRRARA